jgi:Common central domain of tyrosinase
MRPASSQVTSQQALWSNAQTIARKYPLSQREDYTPAASTLRVPYWDWAAAPALPEVVTTRSITVNTPDGSHGTDNPLFNYTFQTDAVGNGFLSSGPVSLHPTMKTKNSAKPRRWIAMALRLYWLGKRYYGTKGCEPWGSYQQFGSIKRCHSDLSAVADEERGCRDPTLRRRLRTH